RPGEHENPGADDRADAEHGQVERAEGPLQAVVREGLGLELGDALPAEKIHASLVMSASSCRNDGEMAARVGPAGGPVKRLEAVIRSFAGDYDVVRVGLPQPGTRDLDELGLGPERVDVAHAAVAHAAAQPTHHLKDHVRGRPSVGHASLDAFGHELGRRDLAFLEVTISGAFFHGAEAAHAADHLEAPALEQERLTRALLRAGEHEAHHYALGARG